MIGANQLGKRGSMLAVLVGVVSLGAGQGVRADLPLPHTSSGNVNAPLLRLTNTNGGPIAWAFRGTGTYGFVGDSSVIGGAGARGTFFDAATGQARASGNLGRSDAIGNYYGVWGKLFSGVGGAAVYGLSESATGNAAFLAINNPASSGYALDVRCNGTVASRAIVAQQNGLGHCAVFELANGSAIANAVSARSSARGATIDAVNTGQGRAGWFEVFNEANLAPALLARTNGSGDAFQAITTFSGRAGFFQSINPDSGVPALEVHHNGMYTAVQTIQTGSRGPAGGFFILNSSNISAAMLAATTGPGLACSCAGDSLVDGDLEVRGGLTPSAAAIKIDHPLDPGNRYLQLPAVHSAEMTNLFKGVIVLDQNGEAWVELPEWFEAANRDFTYHLTPIGAPAPGLYVAQEVQNNTFQIAGGSAGLKVSWQVTGIRQDPYALLKPVVVEVDKPPHEVGRYRHPEAYGLPEEHGLHYEEYEQVRAQAAEDQTIAEAAENDVSARD